MSRRAPLAVLTIITVQVVAATIATQPARAADGSTASFVPPVIAALPSKPVPSLEPQVTDRLWSRLVRDAEPLSFGPAQASCRPARVVFYAANDWLRLATTLAANASPCADYYISVPPLTSDKTRPRPNQAQRIRALGPRFHALAEVHMGGWRSWVNANGASWREAGVEARRRMAAAGYDVALGDTWAVNEFSSAVRRGTAAARSEARDFVRGLFEGDGSVPQSRGVVFMVGVGQDVSDLRDYRARMQTWMLEQDFWVDMNAFVADWSIEVYGDARYYGVPGTSLAERRDTLNHYLQHQLALARTGPPEAGAARTYLERAHSPLANAAWQWASSFGNTVIPAEAMQSYVSAQTYAMRFYANGNGDADRFGFAWAPRNLGGILPGEFARQARGVLERMAAAIRDSGTTLDAGDPGAGACGTPGTNTWCGADVDGARTTSAWGRFATWVEASLVFTTAPQTIPADVPSGALTLQLQQGRFPVAARSDVAVTLTSDSPAGAFATALEGPWSPTLALTIPAGATVSGAFYYRDTRAGVSVVSATAAGYATGTQEQTILGGPAISVRIDPPTVSVVAGAREELTVDGVDAYGNLVPATAPVWALAPGTPGTLEPTTGRTVTYTADGPGSGAVVVTAEGETGPLSASAEITVSPPPVVRVASITYRRVGPRLRVDVVAVDAAGKPVPNAAVAVLVRRNGGRHLTAARRTGALGRAAFRPAARPGCFRTRVTRVAASGHRWNGKTPANRFCIKPKPKRARTAKAKATD